MFEVKKINTPHVSFRADKLSEERRLRTGFSPPGRPKKLRKNLYETLETAVDHR